MQSRTKYHRFLSSIWPTLTKWKEGSFFSAKGSFFNLFKLILDYAITIPFLVLLSPLFMIIGILVKIDSPGPIIYRRRVLGKNGRHFIAYKFRTMHTAGDTLLSEEEQKVLKAELKLKDDPRITRLGKFLRRYSLDELPQLFNVLKRDMSLIGPRMLTEIELARFGPLAEIVLSVKPGLSGLWQVNGRASTTVEDRIYLNMKYIINWSPTLEFSIILHTIPAVLGGRGAY